jgi:hypothetical protein
MVDDGDYQIRESSQELQLYSKVCCIISILFLIVNLRLILSRSGGLTDRRTQHFAPWHADLTPKLVSQTIYLQSPFLIQYPPKQDGSSSGYMRSLKI